MCEQIKSPHFSHLFSNKPFEISNILTTHLDRKLIVYQKISFVFIYEFCLKSFLKTVEFRFKFMKKHDLNRARYISGPSRL